MLASPLLDALGELGRREVLVPRVDGLELGAVDGHHRLREQVELTAQPDELATHGSDGWSVVLAEASDGLVIRLELAGEPHQLEVAAGLLLEAAAGRDTVEIAVDTDLEQGRRMIGRAACHLRDDTPEPQSAQVEFLDKDVDHPHWIVVADVLVEAGGE
jgi:hypothetical protein